jgi:hypothetical protein
MYLERADYLQMEFGTDSAKMAHMLPNDAVLLFAASRERAQAFTRPVPTFFSAAAEASRLEQATSKP